jgi:hypothetical protein
MTRPVWESKNKFTAEGAEDAEETIKIGLRILRNPGHFMVSVRPP